MMKHRFSQAALLVATFATAALVLGACAGTRAAYQSADTLDDYAIVLSEHFNALQVEANDIADAGAPQALIDELAAAELEARPVILELRSVAEAYKATRTSTTEAELQAALDRAALVLADFTRLVRE